MTSVCSWPAPLACLVIRKPLRFWPKARNQAKTRQGPSFAQQKFFAPCLKSLVLSECGGAKEGEGGRPGKRGFCAMDSGMVGWLAGWALSARTRLGFGGLRRNPLWLPRGDAGLIVIAEVVDGPRNGEVAVSSMSCQARMKTTSFALLRWHVGCEQQDLRRILPSTAGFQSVIKAQRR